MPAVAELPDTSAARDFLGEEFQALVRDTQHTKGDLGHSVGEGFSA